MGKIDLEYSVQWLGALLGLTTDKLIASENGLALVRNIMQDVLKIAASCGVDFLLAIIAQKIDHTRTMGAYKTSSQVDVEFSRPVEIAAIIGNPLAIGRKNNVLTPYIEMLCPHNQLCVAQLK